MRIAVYVCLIMFVALTINCHRDSDEQTAKRLLEEVNAIMVQQEASLKSLPANSSDIFSSENLSRFPSNREQLKIPAREMMRFNEIHIARQEQMASKFDGISRLNLDENFRRYARLQARAFRKRAEGVGLLNERLALLLDESIKDQEIFQAKVELITRRREQVDREAKELETQLSKIPKHQQ
jgi:hypothetical protein